MPWSRRRAVAASASVIAAVALAAAMAGRGCEVDEDSPAGVVHAFVAAAEAEDADAVLELLGPATRAGLAESARQATALAGSARRFDPADMLGIGPRRSHSAHSVEVVEISADRAYVELVDGRGPPTRVSLVRANGHWRIELPPYDAPAQSPSR